MWADKAIFYHIYPLGFCGAPKYNDFASAPQNRLAKIAKWIPHFQNQNINAVYLGPVFESSVHGYDTKNYFEVDRRLGMNTDLINLIKILHHSNIKIILDGVFNHVGREFFAFADVRRNKENSKYCGWFKLDFTKDNHFNDGFCYEGWDGCDDIVKLNLKNKEVRDYLLSVVSFWITEFDIDGLRLDVAGYLNRKFLRMLHHRSIGIKSDFWLMGEMVFGNYKKIINSDMLHSVTNYELYKAFHSSCNRQDISELAQTLNRQFNANNGVYKQLALYSFLDNHDVSRIATKLKNKSLLKILYGLLFTLPGIPSVYYGSEWGLDGCRKQGDEKVRSCIELQPSNDLSEHIAWWSSFRQKNMALQFGEYIEYYSSKNILIFARRLEKQEIIIGVNISLDNCQYEHFDQNFMLPPQNITLLKY